MNIFRHRYSKAFTLLETAIVIGILSLVLSGGLAIYRVQMVKERMDTTRARMDNIRDALANYKLKNGGRLPCPAALNDNPSTAPNFAKEPATPCNAPPAPVVAGQPLLTDGTFRPATTPIPANKVRIGAVPVTTLGLSVEHMVDKWGRRFVYAVSENLASAGGLPAPAYDAGTYGGITLKAPNGATLGPITDHTPFVLLSMGKTGQGGYTYEGKLFAPCSGTLETENCDFNNATFTAGIYADVEDVTKRFDDIVVNNLGNLSGLPADKIVVCSALGKFYSPLDLTRDSNDCVSGGGNDKCGPKGMINGGSTYAGPKDIDGCVLTPVIGPDISPSCNTRGTLRYNTNSNKLEYCDHTNRWQQAGAAGGSGKTPDVQFFATNGTWIKPASFPPSSMVIIQCWAPGGGGGSASNCTSPDNNGQAHAYSGGGGGGGGRYSEKKITLSSLPGTMPVAVNGGAAGGGDGRALVGISGAFLTVEGGRGGKIATGFYNSRYCNRKGSCWTTYCIPADPPCVGGAGGDGGKGGDCGGPGGASSSSRVAAHGGLGGVASTVRKNNGGSVAVLGNPMPGGNGLCVLITTES